MMTRIFAAMMLVSSFTVLAQTPAQLAAENQRLRAEVASLKATIDDLKAQIAAMKKPATMPVGVKAPRKVEDLEEFNAHVIGMSLKEFSAILDSKPIMKSASANRSVYTVGLGLEGGYAREYTVVVVDGKITSFDCRIWP